jgi:uncharacterized protein YndB with AHSA1/START domain
MPDEQQDTSRKLELEISVPGTPDEVWQAIATGPGISSWYVPHTVEERPGGAALASFGDAPELQISGRVAAWEPPHRIVFDGGEGVDGLAFEWLIEARAGGTCVVRLVNSGFGSGEEWDAHYHAMEEGWKLFLFNLRLHMQHFRGQAGVAMLPMATWPGTREETWQQLTTSLQISASTKTGENFTLDVADAPLLKGTIADFSPYRMALLFEQPAPGTGIIAVEGHGGDQVAVSIWSYFYGPDASEVIERDKPRWEAWFQAHTPNDG